MACAVINALGDRFDFLVFYTDFRLDRIVATASGLGGIGDSVSGVNPSGSRPEDWCSDGQLQGGQNVSYIGSPILHAREGTDSIGTFGNYDRQVSLLSHELGHRWLSPMRAMVGGQTRTVADTDGHWLFELHAPAAFSVAAEVENSPMGGSFWQDNGDGTFTLFAQPFLQAGGYSYLDLYLMGLLAQEDVPVFFLVEDPQFEGYDTDGNQVFGGTRTDISVEDEIAENGPRLPIFEASQKEFNIGFIGIVQPGSAPSQQLLERMAGIRAAFTDYWAQATGGVSTMNDPLAPKTVLVANFANGNDAELDSRVYLFNPSQSARNVAVRVFTLPLMGSTAQELTVTPLNLGSLGAKSALNIKLAEDILAPLGITLPYTDNDGGLTLEFTIGAANVRGATQVFSSSLAFGTNPLQEVPSTSSGNPTVLVANFVNGNDAAFNSRVYLFNPSASAGAVTVRIFTLPLSDGTAQELTGAPLDLGLLGAKSAMNINVADDLLTPAGITTPYTDNGGNLTLEFTIQAADVKGAAQVFSSSFGFGVYPLQRIPSTPGASPTVLVANFMNGNSDAFSARVYLWNPSASAGDLTVRVFSLPLKDGTAQELTTTPFSLGSLAAKSARNIKLFEDILMPLSITTPYVTDGGNLTLEFTIQAADVVGAAQVFSSSFAFGTNPLQEVPSTPGASPTVLVANFMNGNSDALNSRVYLWNPSASAGDVTVRVFSLPLKNGTAQELTTTPFNLGPLAARSALNIKLVEDILLPLGTTLPYVTDGGNLTLEFTIQAADVRGAAQVFSSSFAFGTYIIQDPPGQSSGGGTPDPEPDPDPGDGEEY
ncbi:MAG: hypothetical protein IH937_06400 [Acidobacteria bacterium]|nr:hypothetical protein [Acidobacteriota bacterium]